MMRTLMVLYRYTFHVNSSQMASTSMMLAIDGLRGPNNVSVDNIVYSYLDNGYLL